MNKNPASQGKGPGLPLSRASRTPQQQDSLPALKGNRPGSLCRATQLQAGSGLSTCTLVAGDKWLPQQQHPPSRGPSGGHPAGPAGEQMGTRPGEVGSGEHKKLPHPAAINHLLGANGKGPLRPPKPPPSAFGAPGMFSSATSAGEPPRPRAVYRGAWRGRGLGERWPRERRPSGSRLVLEGPDGAAPAPQPPPPANPAPSGGSAAAEAAPGRPRQSLRAGGGSEKRRANRDSPPGLPPPPAGGSD